MQPRSKERHVSQFLSSIDIEIHTNRKSIKSFSIMKILNYKVKEFGNMFGRDEYFMGFYI